MEFQVPLLRPARGRHVVLPAARAAARPDRAGASASFRRGRRGRQRTSDVGLYSLDPCVP